MRISFNRAWVLLVLMVIPGFAALGRAQATEQTLSVHWEELTGADFIVAIQRAHGTCLLPFGILEKQRVLREGEPPAGYETIKAGEVALPSSPADCRKG